MRFFEGVSTFFYPKIALRYAQEILGVKRFQPLKKFLKMPHFMFCLQKNNLPTFRISGTLLVKPSLLIPHGLCNICAHISLTHHTDFLLTDWAFCATISFTYMLEIFERYTYSESSFPGCFNDTSFSSLGLF